MARTDDPTRHVAYKAQPRKEQNQRPNLAGTNPAKWPVRPVREQGQEDEGHDGESHA
jgi:hypothetical protein